MSILYFDPHKDNAADVLGELIGLTAFLSDVVTQEAKPGAEIRFREAATTGLYMILAVIEKSLLALSERDLVDPWKGV
jgi:hypothetical protein